ncbi:hypothetical protein [Pseudonocardia sp. TRM90224]|uniref:hypothetical protein n=1 Tax=Pseudonocardia sp. TRM90224 TaxID=2812678 RepID=UPI001E5C0025|nr:hypothetical protein [Pseudonocardia sp. TRM90224]
MTFRHGTFAYTWDVLGDPAAADRIAELGVDTVTLQASYHSVRATTAWHPRHRVVHAQHAAGYFRLRPEAWAGRQLVPPAPEWGVDDPDRFGTAAAALAEAGLRVEAWMVLTHSSALGTANPQLTVRNAFGESYPYALCPAREAVREYASTLVAEVCAQYDVPTLMLEACGWLGFEHGSHHEKTSGTDLSACGRDLLSICLCTACSAALVDRGVDAERLAADVRALVDGEQQRGVPAGATVAEAIGDERAQALYAHRTGVISGMVRDARALAGEREVLLMVTDNPQATGPDVGLDLATFDEQVDAYVLKCWETAGAADRIAATAARTSVPLVANATVVGDRPDGTAEMIAAVAAAGAGQARYYHAGLASPARLGALRAAVKEVR